MRQAVLDAAGLTPTAITVLVPPSYLMMTDAGLATLAMQNMPFDISEVAMR
jgi:hypothetical protein